MSDYIRYQQHPERRGENENYYRREGYDQSNYGTHSRDSQGRLYSEEINRGYSSYGAAEENPYRGVHYPGDAYDGNFSGRNYDRDFNFGANHRGRQQYYGSYNSLDYDDIDRRHDWRRSEGRDDWHNNPANLGVRSNYAYNSGGYGSTFGGEYGYYPRREARYEVSSRDGGYNNPYHRSYDRSDREYSSYSGRYDRDYERRWERDNRDWWDRTRDEVASWFGDEDAERRRRFDKYQGEYRGRGPKGYRRSDSRIEEDINDRLSEDGWVDASDIEVNVENGDVTLTGTTPDRFSKRRAEDIAESVSGVHNVENRVRVLQQDINQAAAYRPMDRDASERGENRNSPNVSNGKGGTRPAL